MSLPPSANNIFEINKDSYNILFDNYFEKKISLRMLCILTRCVLDIVLNKVIGWLFLLVICLEKVKWKR